MKNKLALRDKFKLLKQQRKALLATNFYNFETLRGVAEAAVATQQPLILQLTKSSIDYMGLPVAVAMANSMIGACQLESWLHLDHGDSIELVARCLDAGFQSVMIDASEKSFSENVRITREVVKRSEKYNACVEAELGFIAKLGQDPNIRRFTDPAEAKSFAEATGIDTLAVAIGSAHGFYKEPPNLDLERLQEISELTGLPIVLHGASGISDEMLQLSVQKGICKINLATEIKNIFMLQLKAALAGQDEIDLRKLFPPATRAVKQLVQKKMELLQ